jgi:hypothetical protein
MLHVATMHPMQGSGFSEMPKENNMYKLAHNTAPESAPASSLIAVNVPIQRDATGAWQLAASTRKELDGQVARWARQPCKKPGKAARTTHSQFQHHLKNMQPLRD